MKIDKHWMIISLLIFNVLNNQNIKMKMSHTHRFFFWLVVNIHHHLWNTFLKVFKTSIYKFFVGIIRKELCRLISLSDKIIFLWVSNELKQNIKRKIIVLFQVLKFLFPQKLTYFFQNNQETEIKCLVPLAAFNFLNKAWWLIKSFIFSFYLQNFCFSNDIFHHHLRNCQSKAKNSWYWINNKIISFHFQKNIF
jgi:hypothetical protein